MNEGQMKWMNDWKIMNEIEWYANKHFLLNENYKKCPPFIFVYMAFIQMN